MASPTLPFDTTDCRRYFRRVVAEQTRARQHRMRHARQSAPQRRAPVRPAPPAVAPGTETLSATAAMQWLQLRAKPFYLWRNTLGIIPIVKANHQALYARQDLVRLYAAYLAHMRGEEGPYDG